MTREQRETGSSLHERIVGHERFLAESSDLPHMGVYTSMGIISVWALFTGEYGNC